MAEGNYGGFWIRFLAYLVDSVVLCTALFILTFVAAFVGETGLYLVCALVVLGPILYWGLMQASPRQATFGKALLGMKVTDASGNRLTLPRSLGRELAKIASVIPLGLGYVMAAFTGRKQALHDMVASTLVARESKGHVLVGLLVGVFGWLAPAALAMFVGGAALAVMMGTMGGSVLGPMTKDEPKTVPTQKAATAPTPSPAPAVPVVVAAAPAAAAAPGVDVDALLKTGLEGFDKPSTAKAGPAVMEFYPSLGSRLRLRSYLRPEKELEGTKLAINLSKVLDGKGAELSDPNNRMAQGQSFLRLEQEPGQSLSGMHIIQLRAGTSADAVSRVEAVLVVNVPSNRAVASFSAADVGKPQTVAGVKLTLKQLNGAEAKFDYAGDQAKLVYAAGLSADNKPVHADRWSGQGGGLTMRFDGPPARIDLVLADKFVDRPYSLILTKAAGQQIEARPKAAANAQVAAAPKPEPAEPKMASLPRPAPVAVLERPSAPGPKYNDLMTAVIVADPAALQELLSFGKWPDKPDSNGLTPLTVATIRGDRDSAELLLKAGADPDRALAVARQRADPALTTLLEKYRK